MSTNKTLSSKGFQEYSTPWYFMDKVNEVFPTIFDLAADKKNSKCGNHFYSIKDNAFNQDWSKLYSEITEDDITVGKAYLWLNPPYCAPQKKCESDCKKKTCINRGFHNKIDQPGITKWMEKCVMEAKAGARIVVLTQAERSSKWYRQLVRPNALSLILGARLRFEGEKDPYTKALMINVFGTGITGEGYWDF